MKDAGTKTVIGQALSRITKEMDKHVRKVQGMQYDINAYHITVINEFRWRLDNDYKMLANYRID